jgi:hypothetical protein
MLKYDLGNRYLEVSSFVTVLGKIVTTLHKTAKNISRIVAATVYF